MKLRILKKLSFVIIVAGIVFLNACHTASIPLEVLLPAEINIPQHIENVAVANRSLPADNKKVTNILEGLLTGESLFADRVGSNHCIEGLVEKLNTSPRFVALLYGGDELKGTGTKTFATPLDWAKVDDICLRNKVDALILLETFDSDMHINKGSRKEKRTKDEEVYYVTVFHADLTVNVNAGWRIYDQKNHRIIDQKTFRDVKNWSSKGNTPDDALHKLPNKRRAINDAAIFAGNRFAVRISPTWTHSSRIYYTGKIDDFKLAKKYVQNKDWDMAIAIWKHHVDDPEPKIGGRACFNMGIASEMKGEFDIALKWMKKAYYDYDIKKAQQYINILNKRIIDQQKLDEQMGN